MFATSCIYEKSVKDRQWVEFCQSENPIARHAYNGCTLQVMEPSTILGAVIGGYINKVQMMSRALFFYLWMTATFCVAMRSRAWVTTCPVIKENTVSQWPSLPVSMQSSHAYLSSRLPLITSTERTWVLSSSRSYCTYKLIVLSFKSIKVLFSQVLPAWATTVLLGALLTFITYKLLVRGVITWRSESSEKHHHPEITEPLLEDQGEAQDQPQGICTLCNYCNSDISLDIFALKVLSLHDSQPWKRSYCTVLFV